MQIYIHSAHTHMQASMCKNNFLNDIQETVYSGNLCRLGLKRTRKNFHAHCLPSNAIWTFYREQQLILIFLHNKVNICGTILLWVCLCRIWLLIPINKIKICEVPFFFLDVSSKTIGTISGTFGCTAGISGGLSMSLRASDAFIILLEGSIAACSPRSITSPVLYSVSGKHSLLRTKGKMEKISFADCLCRLHALSLEVMWLP